MPDQPRSDELSELVADAMRPYAEAAMRHGWETAANAVKSGTLSGSWEGDWFERNPPICAMPEELCDAIERLKEENERLREALEQIDSQPTLIRRVTDSTMRVDEHEVLSAYHVRKITRSALSTREK